MEKVVIIGGGLAGSEAAWQVAQRGMKVELYEMRPRVMTPAHRSAYLAELVCSNSFRASSLENAAGLLKEEMRLLGSLIMRCADENTVPAGGALAVDRNLFAASVTEAIEEHPLIQVKREEVTRLPEHRPLIIATGPLTSDGLAREIHRLTGEQYLYFYDAASPIVTGDSIDYNKVFRGSRYDKGEPAYLNCPLDEEEYRAFWEALVSAERYPLHEFEKAVYFEGCLPVEVIASRGPETLRFGPLKPVGLVDPRTGRQPHAVVQLRPEDREGRLYNLVGFQTNLRWGEQERIFRLIPGLEKAEFVRFGFMHRNTFINSPRLLRPTLEMINYPGIFFAGQITGVEGYIESASNGLVAGINAFRLARGLDPIIFPPDTAHGALCHYIAHADPGHFQPMNINFGLLPPLKAKIKDRRRRNLKLSERALTRIKYFVEELDS